MTIETQQDVSNFIAFVKENGGEVNKVLELRQGYEFFILPPANAPIGWGALMMEQFIAKR